MTVIYNFLLYCGGFIVSFVVDAPAQKFQKMSLRLVVPVQLLFATIFVLSNVYAYTQTATHLPRLITTIDDNINGFNGYLPTGYANNTENHPLTRDHDGTITYSHIRKVRAASTVNKIVVFPNPFGSRLLITLPRPESGNITCIITNTAGV